MALLTAPMGGVLKSGRRSEIVERILVTARSIEYEALVVADGTAPSDASKLVVMLQEAYRHFKPIGAWGNGAEALTAAGIPHDGPGVLLSEEADKEFTASLTTALGLHRVWNRNPAAIRSAEQ